MTFNEAAFGIDESLNMKGTLLVPSQFADYTPYPTSMLERGRTMLKLAQLNRSAVYEEFRSPKIGSPVLLFLVVLGLFRKPWSHRRLLQETVLMVMAASILILLLMATVETNFRYFFPLVPLLLLWAGMGMEQLGQWARGLARLNRELLPPSKIVGAGVQIIAASMMVLLSAWGTRSAYEFAMQQVDRSATRDAGLWLRQYSPGPKRVAARLTIFPYYAEATLVQFPYANEELTQRYLDAKQVDFVVLESQYAGNWPTIEAWIAHGIPDDHARLIYDVKNASGDRVVIYSWQQVR
jgi:hypothetical protein